jgi:hypothetical protein
MALLPEQPNKTAELIYSTYTNSPPRPHLGASQIGENCQRKLWYSYHHCKLPEFSGRMLRLFESGFREESRIIMNLRQAGIQVWDRGDDGTQINFKMFGGRFSGSVDGIVLGIPEAPKTEHLLEIKTSSDKNYKALIKNGVEKAKSLHYAQMQVYLGAFNLTRALYIVVNKNDDSIYSERIEFHKPTYDLLINKAERIVTSDAPLERCESFECKWCEYQKICEWEELPHISCRVCAHWGKCETEEVCEKHIFNPHLIHSEAVDASEEEGWILYADGRKNGPGYLKSEEMGI